MQQWEQRVIHVGLTDWKALDREIQRLGAEGWEAVAISGADKTVGTNALVAIVRRPIMPPEPLPEGSPPEWYPDPCLRWEKRYWNGVVWTAHVANVTAKERSVDPPQTLPSGD